MGRISSRLVAASSIIALAVFGQSATAATAANGALSNVQASAGSSAFEAAVAGNWDGNLYAGDGADGNAGGWQIGSEATPIGLDYSAGAGYYTWTIQNTVGANGDPSGADYIPGATRYDVFMYVENTGTEAWSRFDMFLSECCYRIGDDEGLYSGPFALDSSSNNILAGFDQKLPQRRMIFDFTNPVQPGESAFLGVNIFYSMPIPLVTDGDKLFHMAPTAVPVPAAVWLFGSAIGLLGWMRRRNAA